MLSALLIFAVPKFTAPFPLSPDGSSFIEPSESSAVLRVMDAQTGKTKRELKGLGFRPYVVRFSPDGTLLAASNTLGEVCLWTVDSGKLIFKVTDADSQRRVAYLPLLFSPDGRSLTVGNLHLTRRARPDLEMAEEQAVLSQWNTKTGKRISEVRVGDAWPISTFAFVVGGRTLRVLGASITDFDLPLGKFSGKGWARHVYAMSDDGTLASEYTPDWIDVWDIASRRGTLRLKDPELRPIERLVFAPGRKSFAVLRKRSVSYADTGHTLFSAELRSYPEGKLLWTTPEARHDTLCFSPDGVTVLLPNLELRRVASGKVLRTFRDTERPALGIAGSWHVLPRHEAPDRGMGPNTLSIFEVIGSYGLSPIFPSEAVSEGKFDSL